MFTLNNILQQAELFCQSHKQINNFYFGEIPELNAQASNRHVLLFMELSSDSGSRDELLNSFNFNCWVIDQPNKNGNSRSKQEILSDTRLICEDFIAFWRYTNFDSPMKIELPISLQDMTDVLDDEDAGWSFVLKISLANGLDLCSIPSSGYVPPIDYNKVLIRDIKTGEILYRIPAGQSFFIERLQEIIDDLENNTTTIISPLN